MPRRAPSTVRVGRGGAPGLSLARPAPLEHGGQGRVSRWRSPPP